MDRIDIKNFISEDDCDIYVAYLIEKLGLTYSQALQVVDLLSEMINKAALNIIEGASTSEDC